MALSKRYKHGLVRLLAGLAVDANMAKTLATQAELDVTQIMFSDKAVDNWNNIVSFADEGDQLNQLLDVVANHFKNDKLNNYQNDLQNGFSKRVNSIATAIHQNECVLFLGPEVLQCLNEGQTQPFNNFLAGKLAQELERKGVYFDAEHRNSLSYIAQRYEEMPTFISGDLAKKAQKNFAEVSKHLGVYEQIAQWRFPLIINTNPDNSLEELYRNHKRPFSSGYYDMSNDADNVSAITPDATYIYNIFGSFQNPFSILFTDIDKVKFARNVVKNDPPIPTAIKKALENKYYLFVGFDFNEWHLKILIDSLGLARKEDRSFAIPAQAEDVNETNNEYFEKEFKFYFINKEMQQFLTHVGTAYQQIKPVPDGN
jgi:hypothetical protein